MENVPEQKSFTPLLIFSIVSLVIIYGGLVCSYLFWKDHVNGQFGLLMPFTFLLFVLMNCAFKIPAIVDTVLLFNSSGKGKRFAAVIIISMVISAGAEFAMFLAARGSNLG